MLIDIYLGDQDSLQDQISLGLVVAISLDKELQLKYEGESLHISPQDSFAKILNKYHAKEDSKK